MNVLHLLLKNVKLNTNNNPKQGIHIPKERDCVC